MGGPQTEPSAGGAARACTGRTECFDIDRSPISSAFPSGCEWRVPLLKLHVCRDAAVCAVRVGGFLCVLKRLPQSGRLAPRFFGLTPLEHFSSVTVVRRYSTHRFWPLRKGDNEWQSTM
jgi:hypothetical protein